jgi:hypothetical protein
VGQLDVEPLGLQASLQHLAEMHLVLDHEHPHVTECGGCRPDAGVAD